MRFTASLLPPLILFAACLAPACGSSESGSPNTLPTTDASVGGAAGDASVGGGAGSSGDGGQSGASGAGGLPGDGGSAGSSGSADAAAGSGGSDTDAEPDAQQDAPSDAACAPLGGLGTVTCDCNGLDDTEWSSSSPFVFVNHIDFGTTGWDTTQLTPGGKEILAEGNLGGSSIESEIQAEEMLARCEFATLLKSEGEVDYQDAGKATDMILVIDGHKVGVSVTRAYHYPPTNPYTVAEAVTLLSKKLADIPLAKANAMPADVWERSFLSVLAWDQQYSDTVVTAWNQLDAGLKADVILFVTVTDGDDSAIY